MADMDDELPLPSFLEVFGDGHPDTILVANNAALARRRLANRKAGARMGMGDESLGRWTAEEQRLFLEGLMLYGKDWKKMAPLIKTRTLVQIRTHAQKVFKKMGLKMMDPKGKRAGQKRGLDEDDDAFDEERLNELKQSGQLEGMIASGELHLNDEIADAELKKATSIIAPHHPNPHLVPQESSVRLPGAPAVTVQTEWTQPSHAMLASMQPKGLDDDTNKTAPTGSNSIPQPPRTMQVAATSQMSAPGPVPMLGPPHGGVAGSSPYMIQPVAVAQQYHQMQQAALLQQQEYMRQQQQFMLHQQLQQEEYKRQVAYQQQQNAYLGPPH